MLTAVLDLVGRVAVPGRVIARLQGFIEPPVGGDIGPELIILLGKKRVRPARRGDDRGSPGAVRHDTRSGSADFHAARRAG